MMITLQPESNKLLLHCAIQSSRDTIQYRFDSICWFVPRNTSLPSWLKYQRINFIIDSVFGFSDQYNLLGSKSAVDIYVYLYLIFDVKIQQEKNQIVHSTWFLLPIIKELISPLISPNQPIEINNTLQYFSIRKYREHFYLEQFVIL